MAWLLCQVYSFAEKRPRAMAVLSLHLCPLLLSGPSTVLPHAALVQQLLLYSADDVSSCVTDWNLQVTSCYDADQCRNVVQS